MTVLENTRPVARKQHRCDICLGFIGEGDQYRRQRGIWEGEPYTHKAHALCNAAYWQTMRDLDYDANYDEYAEWSEVRPYVDAFFANVVVAALSGADYMRASHLPESVQVGPEIPVGRAAARSVPANGEDRR